MSTVPFHPALSVPRESLSRVIQPRCNKRGETEDSLALVDEIRTLIKRKQDASVATTAVAFHHSVLHTQVSSSLFLFFAS